MSSPIVFVENLNVYKNRLLEELAEFDSFTLITTKTQTAPSGFEMVVSLCAESELDGESERILWVMKSLMALSRNSRNEVITAARTSQLRSGGSYLTWLGHWCRYFRDTVGAIKSLDSSAAAIWSEFTPMSRVFSAACKHLGLKIAFLEYGVFPDTLTASDAQAGGHWVRTNKRLFSTIPIDGEDSQKAKQIVKKIRQLHFETHQKHRESGSRPAAKKLLFLANHHIDSGVVDKNRLRAKLQKGRWSDNFDAFENLSNFCTEFGISLVYRTHPLWKKIPGELPESVSVDYADSRESIGLAILGADVVATLNSSSAFLAVILQKPVLIMGGSPLMSSDFIYKAQTKKTLRSSLALVLGNPGSALLYEAEVQEFMAKWIKAEIYAHRGEVFGVKTNGISDLARDLTNWSNSESFSLDLVKLARLGIIARRT